MARSKQFNRGLSSEFIAELAQGRFAPLLAASTAEGLDVQVRENYLNFYYDGCSVLALREHAVAPRYRAKIHRKFLDAFLLPDGLTPEGSYWRFDATSCFADAFTKHLPTILCNAARYAGDEAIVEQRMVHAAAGSDSPVLFIDRQVQVPGVRKKIDLAGIIRSGQLVIAEIKQGCDNRIQDLMDQISAYYTVLTDGQGRPSPQVARSYGRVLDQKRLLGLLPAHAPTLADRTPVTCLLTLYGYNPRSELLARLRQASCGHRLPVSLVLLPSGSYTLPPVAEWEQLCRPE